MRRNTFDCFAILGSVILVFASEAAIAQQEISRKSIDVPLTENRPTIDGVVDDDEWRDAVVLNDFHQFEPADHGTPSEASTFWIKYDKDFLYIAARLKDSEPDKIAARQLIHGQSLRYDDAYEVILDPFDSGRSGYKFQTNANGMRHEALFEDPTELNYDWDTIWDTEGRIVKDGWESEMAIPFKSLNFDPNNADWGITIGRTIARKKEELAWVSYGRQINTTTTGLLQGIDKAEQGIGLDIVPALVSRVVDADGGTDSEIQPSLDVFYNFTPSLTGVLTINTDFAATEVDDRVVDLSRFDVFFPEKRAFFLQDADIFAFGGMREENGLPYFSRRIGLGDDGEPLDITAGAKLTGRVGNLSVGVLAVDQDHGTTDSNETVFVGKFGYQFLEHSTIGAIFTDGNPLDDKSNSLWGVDYRYRTPDLVTDGNVIVDAWYQQSTTEGLDADDTAWGLTARLDRGEGLRGHITTKRIGENFFPALGFVNRTGIKASELEVSFNKRFNHPLVRKFIPGFRVGEVTKTSGDLESREIALQPFMFINDPGDSLKLNLVRDHEVVDQAFDLVPGVVVNAGDYEFDSAHVEFEMAQERKFAFAAEAGWGDFFDGDKLSYELRFDYRPSRHLYLALGYEVNDGEVSGGAFMTRLIDLRADIAFNSKWSWANLIQYDNVSESMGINSRLRWNRTAGQDLYIVLNQGLSREDSSRSFSTDISELSLKLSYAFRF